jgi:hypothetical protein
MTTIDFNTLPADIHPLLENIIGGITASIDNQRFVQPIWFMVDRKKERMMPFSTSFSSDDDRRVVAHLIRTLVLAQQPHVDAVVFICEAWRKKLMKGDPEFEHRTKPVKDLPGREDILMIMVETHEGIWIANAVIKGEPEHERELTPIRFELEHTISGQMANFLPNKKGMH